LIEFRTPGKEDQLIGSNLPERVNSIAELLLCGLMMLAPPCA